MQAEAEQLTVTLTIFAQRGKMKAAEHGLFAALADAAKKAGALDGADTDVLTFDTDESGELRLLSVDPGTLTKDAAQQ